MHRRRRAHAFVIPQGYRAAAALDAFHVSLCDLLCHFEYGMRFEAVKMPRLCVSISQTLLHLPGHALESSCSERKHLFVLSRKENVQTENTRPCNRCTASPPAPTKNYPVPTRVRKGQHLQQTRLCTENVAYTSVP